MGVVNSIDIRKQRNLGLAGTSRLCIKGISHRLLRSVLTLSVVTLAVAFFMFLLSENALVTAAGKIVNQKIVEQRLASRLLSRLFESPSNLTLSEWLGRSAGQPAALKEFAHVTGLDSAWVSALAEQARQEQRYLHFFEALPPGNRLILVQKWEGRDIFRRLSDRSARETFAKNLAFMRDQRLPGGLDSFQAFLNRFPAYLADLEVFERQWRSATKAFAEASKLRVNGADVETWLVGAQPGSLREWAEFVRTKGFDVTAAQWGIVQSQLRLARAKAAITGRLDTPEARAEWRRLFRDRKPLSTEQKLLRVGDERVAKLLGDVSSREERETVAKAAAREKRLSELERKLAGRIAGDGESGGGLSPRQSFLLFISFLVCAVGVGNAMLMSITERFREIATMKCLGATDGYILTQFMLEAAIQGTAGGALGMVIGFVVALGKQTVILGGTVFAAWPGRELCGSGLIAVSAGILLSVLASIYPAWAASRMAPMEAMRIE